MGLSDTTAHAKSDHFPIDCHIHLWEFTLLKRAWEPPEILRHTFLASDFSDAIRPLSIQGSILIESGTSADDERSMWKLAQPDQVSAVITYLDITDNDMDSKLDLWQAKKKFRGVRIRLEGHPSPEDLFTDHALANLKILASRGVIVEFLVTTNQLMYVVQVADTVPQLKFVIDHMGKPDLINGTDADLWTDHMTRLANHTNAHVKLSISPRADQIPLVENSTFKWRTDVIRDRTQLLLDRFGSCRLMWGSDWPITLLTGDYQDILKTMNDAIGKTNQDSHNLIFGDTARAFYSLY